MYISMPKEFYVPVSYGDRHGLNIWDSNMERQIPLNPEEEATVISEKESNIGAPIPNDDIYATLDEEYANGATTIRRR